MLFISLTVCFSFFVCAISFFFLLFSTVLLLISQCVRLKILFENDASVCCWLKKKKKIFFLIQSSCFHLIESIFIVVNNNKSFESNDLEQRHQQRSNWLWMRQSAIIIIIIDILIGSYGCFICSLDVIQILIFDRQESDYQYQQSSISISPQSVFLLDSDITEANRSNDCRELFSDAMKIKIIA